MGLWFCVLDVWGCLVLVFVRLWLWVVVVANVLGGVLGWVFGCVCFSFVVRLCGVVVVLTSCMNLSVGSRVMA